MRERIQVEMNLAGGGKGAAAYLHDGKELLSVLQSIIYHLSLHVRQHIVRIEIPNTENPKLTSMTTIGIVY